MRSPAHSPSVALHCSSWSSLWSHQALSCALVFPFPVLWPEIWDLGFRTVPWTSCTCECVQGSVVGGERDKDFIPVCVHCTLSGHRSFHQKEGSRCHPLPCMSLCHHQHTQGIAWGLSWERRERKESKSLRYHSQLLWPFSDPQARKEGLYLTLFLSMSGVYSRDLGWLSFSAGWYWREKW